MFSILSAAAERPSRRRKSWARTWIGIDVTHLAVGLMKLRLKDSFGMLPIGTNTTHHRDTESTETSSLENLSDLRASVVNPSYRVIGHVIDRENTAIGVFLTLEPPTKPMLTEAAEKGFYHSPAWNKDYPRLQILTVEDLLAGKTVHLPPNIDTFKKAQKIVAESDDQGKLGFE